MKKSYLIISLLAVIFALSQSAFTGNEPKTPAELGRKLFFDPILSKTKQISCASCHKEEFAFADTSAVSLGVRKQKGIRNTPSAMNMKLQASFFWDGRATTLEQQALMPVANPIEMDLPVRTAVWRLNNSRAYFTAFESVFHEAPNEHNLAKALAEFERTLETSDSPLDDWLLNDNESAVSASAKRGYALFNGKKANCVQCHFGPDFNNVEFRSIGLYDGKMLRDSGRAAITKNPADIGKFKIGALRNVAITAPYMHNGMFKTLRQVIEYYNDPDKAVPHSIGRDTLLAKPMNLSEQEKADLENFLVALTDKRFADKLKRSQLKSMTNDRSSFRRLFYSRILKSVLFELRAWGEQDRKKREQRMRKRSWSFCPQNMGATCRLIFKLIIHHGRITRSYRVRTYPQPEI